MPKSLVKKFRLSQGEWEQVQAHMQELGLNPTCHFSRFVRSRILPKKSKTFVDRELVMQIARLDADINRVVYRLGCCKDGLNQILTKLHIGYTPNSTLKVLYTTLKSLKHTQQELEALRSIYGCQNFAM